MKVVKVLVLVVLFLFSFVLSADVVRLKTGEKLDGKIILEDDEVVVLKKEWGQIIVKKKFVESIEREEDEKKPEEKEEGGVGEKEGKKGDAKDEKQALRLKSRLKAWMGFRKKLLCKSCGGDGKEKCPYCKGTGQQPADPHSKTVRG